MDKKTFYRDCFQKYITIAITLPLYAMTGQRIHEETDALEFSMCLHFHVHLSIEIRHRVDPT